MKIALGADHAGFALKQELSDWLTEAGHQVTDVGTDSIQSVDYPDFARLVAQSVADSLTECGVLICGTGVGMAMTANKVPGVRAVCCSDSYTAAMSREHNDANVISIGARVVGPGVARELIEAFLKTDFGAGRHTARVAKIEGG